MSDFQPGMLTIACSLINGHGLSHSLLIVAESVPGFNFGIRARTEMKIIWCLKDLYILKLKNNSGVNAWLTKLQLN